MSVQSLSQLDVGVNLQHAWAGCFLQSTLHKPSLLADPLIMFDAPLVAADLLRADDCIWEALAHNMLFNPLYSGYLSLLERVARVPAYNVLPPEAVASILIYDVNRSPIITTTTQG